LPIENILITEKPAAVNRRGLFCAGFFEGDFDVATPPEN
jgi:hypothetical protein